VYVPIGYDQQKNDVKMDLPLRNDPLGDGNVYGCSRRLDEPAVKAIYKGKQGLFYGVEELD
jgi:hypothetical protein